MNRLSTLLSALSLGFVLAASVFVWKMGQQIERLGTKLDRQTLVLEHALGDQSLTKVTPEIEAKVESLQSDVASAIKSPPNQQDIRRLDERLNALLDQLPTWVRDEFQPRLAASRWEINSLWILANDPPADLDGISNYASILDDQLSAMPEGASDQLMGRLNVLRSEVGRLQAKAELDSALAQADAAIKDHKDLENALSLLMVYDDEAVKPRAERLRQLIQSQTITRAIGRLEGDLHRALALNQPEDLALRASVLEHLGQAVLDLRWQVLSGDQSDPALTSRLGQFATSVASAAEEVRRKMHVDEAESRKRYQVWALKEIAMVRPYEEIEAEELGKIGGRIDRNNPFSDENLKAKKDASALLSKSMVAHMGDIDQSMLDLAVSQWFQIVYMDRLNALGQADQFKVVRGFANAAKKSLDEVQ